MQSVLAMLMAFFVFLSVIARGRADDQNFTGAAYCKSFTVAALNSPTGPLFCLSQSEVPFERLEVDGFGAGWVDLETGILWRTDASGAVCQGAYGRPSQAQIEEAIRNGILEVLGAKARRSMSVRCILYMDLE